MADYWDNVYILSATDPLHINHANRSSTIAPNDTYRQHYTCMQKHKKLIGNKPYFFFPFNLSNTSSSAPQKEDKVLRLSQFIELTQWTLPKELPGKVRQFVSETTVQEVMTCIDAQCRQLTDQVWFVPLVQFAMISVAIAVFLIGYLNYMKVLNFSLGMIGYLIWFACALVLLLAFWPLKTCLVDPRVKQHQIALQRKLDAIANKSVHEVHFRVEFDSMIRRTCCKRSEVKGMLLVVLPYAFEAPIPVAEEHLNEWVVISPSAVTAGGAQHLFSASRDIDIESDFITLELPEDDVLASSPIRGFMDPRKSRRSQRSFNSSLAERLVQ